MVLKLIIISLGLLVILRAFVQLRRNEFTIVQFAFGFSVWAIAVFFVFFPNVSSGIADIIGVGRGVDALIYLSILLLFYLFYRMYVKLERIERDLTKLVRHEALRKIKTKKQK